MSAENGPRSRSGGQGIGRTSSARPTTRSSARTSSSPVGFQPAKPTDSNRHEFGPHRGSDDHVVCRQLVVAGGGVGFARRTVGERVPGVEVLFGGEPIGQLPVWLTAHAELRTSARIRRVCDHLADALSALRSVRP